MNNQVLDEGIYEEKEDTSEAAVMVLAKRLKRFIAYLIDIVTITALVLIAFSVLGITDNRPDIYFSEEEARRGMLIKRNVLRAISFMIWIIYCTVMEASRYGGTFGKQLMDIKVIDEYGQRLTFKKSAVRNLSKILSQFVLSLGFIWILFDKERQGWHDKIAKTYVVREDN